MENTLENEIMLETMVKVVSEGVFNGLVGEVVKVEGDRVSIKVDSGNGTYYVDVSKDMVEIDSVEVYG